MPLSCNKTKWIGRMPPTPEEVFTQVTYSLFMRTKEGGTWLLSICPLPHSLPFSVLCVPETDL